ncbi:MAG TPA: hypothetical protein VM286_07195 [Candidatus Thermoplasmatota archaeon]|nr:hypothetical protein [Candidatus Thermoplasmatota archaeon]
MFATVKKWGNSYAIRLTKQDLARAGLSVGQQIEFNLRPLPTKRVDLSGLPVVHDSATDVSARHDAYLYGGT